MNIVETGKILLTLLPIISDTIKNVEAQMGSGNGSNKLQLATTIIQSIYDASSPVIPFNTLAGQITQIIGALVAFYNNTRVFVQQAKAA